ncbi:hypothetical protein WJX74_010301 [Apatococcus lobatus]|uniref:Adenosine deaminase domain-containing protein n=1 Tax=Apatococcus lobatus TaxID=904363 RepID=A0AAW1QC52_9CHLO
MSGDDEDQSRSLLNLVRSLPKAELHLHIEGTLEPELMIEIAKRNGLLDSLSFHDANAARQAYLFKNLQGFLNIYYQGCNVLQHEQDFFDLTSAYLERAAVEGVIWAEIMFDPQAHTQRGVAFEAVVKGISRALTAASNSLGIHGCLIMNFMRDLGADAAQKMLDEALPFKHLITAVGLDSAEIGWPPSQFKAVYARAAHEGFKLVAHAGEEGPPDNIWAAVKDLRVSRIDHGIRCLEDEKLIHHLRDTQIPLTVCPISNEKLKVYEGQLSQKLRQLLTCNLVITLNADDPAYFGGYENVMAHPLQQSYC